MIESSGFGVTSMALAAVALGGGVTFGGALGLCGGIGVGCLLNAKPSSTESRRKLGDTSQVLAGAAGQAATQKVTFYGPIILGTVGGALLGGGLVAKELMA